MNCSVVTDWAPGFWESEGELGCADNGKGPPESHCCSGSFCVVSNLAAQELLGVLIKYISTHSSDSDSLEVS